MNQLSKSFLIYNDENYSHAVNYSGHLYNFPITLNFGKKHNRSKYILSAGTSDHIELWQDGVFIYILSQNNGLEYISLQLINTELKAEENSVFLSHNDINDEDSLSYGILDESSDKQINMLCEYL